MKREIGTSSLYARSIICKVIFLVLACLSTPLLHIKMSEILTVLPAVIVLAVVQVR